jgi:hypothetical protein
VRWGTREWAHHLPFPFFVFEAARKPGKKIRIDSVCSTTMSLPSGGGWIDNTHCGAAAITATAATTTPRRRRSNPLFFARSHPRRSVDPRRSQNDKRPHPDVRRPMTTTSVSLQWRPGRLLTVRQYETTRLLPFATVERKCSQGSAPPPLTLIVVFHESSRWAGRPCVIGRTREPDLFRIAPRHRPLPPCRCAKLTILPFCGLGAINAAVVANMVDVFNSSIQARRRCTVVKRTKPRWKIDASTNPSR